MKLLIALVPALPAISAVLIHLLAPTLGRRAARLGVGATGITFALSLLMLYLTASGRAAGQISAGDQYGILLSDPLSAVMSAFVAGISFIVHLYSVRYMAEESGYARFFVLLGLMTATLLIMVAAGDLITLLIAWHLIGVLLYFLLGQDTRSPSAYRYAFWTFFTYRIGDVALVLAAGVLYWAYGTWSLPQIFERVAADPFAHTILGMPVAHTVGTLLALAAFARSAQFLLHTWLPYTMAGPTPVSALMHAGIVNAGGFLINRFSPIFVHTGDVLHGVFFVGLITAIIGSFLMLTQNDIKKSLGYSTMGQMGFMVMECGLGAFSLAIYHLIAHGLFKGTLFLGAGGVIGEARRDDGVPKDPLYTFVVERQPARRSQPWMLMAAITLIVPVTVLLAAHWIVADDFFQKQGAIVLLFFGWMTGAQLIFAMYRMRTENMARLFTLILSSFAIVVLGYAVISHAFDLFLYPDKDFREQIYVAAAIDMVWFHLLMALVTAVVVLGWLITYYSERNRRRSNEKYGPLRMSFYALVSREFYIADVYSWVTRTVLDVASRINAWLRWL